MKNLQEIEQALTNWVDDFYDGGDVTFDKPADDYEFISFYCEGPYVSDDTDDDGKPLEVDENLILYIVSVDIYLADRIKYIKEYKNSNPGSLEIKYDKKRFPLNTQNYDSVCAWYQVDKGYIIFEPDLSAPENKRLVENISAFIDEYMD